MKELQQKEKIEVNVKQQKQVEHQLVGRITPHKGHRLFEINVETLSIKLAEYSNTTYQAFTEDKHEVIIKKGHVYVSALNKRNALKQYKKGKNGSKL